MSYREKAGRNRPAFLLCLALKTSSGVAELLIRTLLKALASSGVKLVGFIIENLVLMAGSSGRVVAIVDDGIDHLLAEQTCTPR